MTKINTVQPKPTSEKVERYAKALRKIGIPEPWDFAILTHIDAFRNMGLKRIPDSASFKPKANGEGYTFTQAWETPSGKLFEYRLSSIIDPNTGKETFTELTLEK